MLNKTYETIQQAIRRFTTILELDNGLKPWERNNIEAVIELLKALEDENSISYDPS